MKDCIIVGGGPAGLTAALYLARFLRSVTVFDARQGRAGMIPRTHNLGAFPDGISGRDLLDRMRSHAELYGAEIEDGTVLSVEQQGDHFMLKTDRRVETAYCIILACGVVNHRPPLSTEVHDQGLARGLVRYCPVCDAHEVRGKRIAVLGTGAHGSEEARFIQTYSSFVTLIPHDGTVANVDGGIGGLASPMKTLALADTQVVVTLESGEIKEFDTLYVAMGTTPRSALAAQLSVRLGSTNHVEVDAKQKTSVEGVYAIGDVTEGLDQIAVAMGQAAIAATAIHNHLRDRRPRK